MRLERFTTLQDREVAVNPDHVHGVSLATDEKGIPILGVCAIQVVGGAILVKGALGEICQQLEGTHGIHR